MIFRKWNGLKLIFFNSNKIQCKNLISLLPLILSRKKHYVAGCDWGEWSLFPPQEKKIWKRKRKKGDCWTPCKSSILLVISRVLSPIWTSLSFVPHSLQRRRRSVALLLHHHRDGRQFHARRVLSRSRRPDLPAHAVQATLRATGSFPFPSICFFSPPKHRTRVQLSSICIFVAFFAANRSFLTVRAFISRNGDSDAMILCVLTWCGTIGRKLIVFVH